MEERGERRKEAVICKLWKFMFEAGTGDWQQQRDLWHGSTDVIVYISEVNTRKNRLIKKGKYPGAREEIKEKEL